MFSLHPDEERDDAEGGPRARGLESRHHCQRRAPERARVAGLLVPHVPGLAGILHIVHGVAAPLGPAPTTSATH